MQEAAFGAAVDRTGATRPHTVSASALIAADPKRIYRILSDYRTGHPSILPPDFSDLVVEHGGVGEGTVIRFQMRLLGRTQTFRAAVSEPEAGRVLVETDLDTNHAVTTFTVDPAGANGTRVTIATRLDTRSGILGPVERLISTWVLRRIYVRQLEILAAVVGKP